MSLPGEDREIDGWDSLVHVMRHRWWLLLIAGVAAAIGVAATLLLNAARTCGVDGGVLSCSTAPGDGLLRPLAAGLVGVAAAMPGLLLGHWMRLRVGAFRHAPCKRCGAEGGPIHEGCPGWLVGKSSVDAEVWLARRHLAWQSIYPRIFVICAALIVAGTATAVYGSTIPHEDNLDDCGTPGPAGQSRQCSNEDTSGRIWWMAGGVLSAIAALATLSFTFSYRLVHPRFHVSSGMDAPPGMG